MSDASENQRQTSAEASEGERSELTVVGIGASAGGLAALRTFFESMPDDSGLAFVVVVHLSSEHPSHLADLLQARIHMPVLQVTRTVPLRRNHVYVIPPNANLESVDTHLRLTALEPRRTERAPIDHFLRTLARTHDGHAIGLILSGTGSDGTLGIKEIKEKGGLTIVQDPFQAEYDGMPSSAIGSGAVDLILPIERMPDVLLGFSRTRPELSIPVDGESLDPANRQMLQRVFAQLRLRSGRDFTRYKPSTILRRIQRRMQLRFVERFDTYLSMLRDDPSEVMALADDLLITVTNFFRDRDVFDEIERTIIPRLFEGRTADDSIRIWSVGCATGEEAYSLAMLMIEEASRHESVPRIQIFASDLHEHSLERARDGYYPGDIDVDVSPGRLKRFFTRENNGYRIRKEVRELVIFTAHNLLSDPPFSRLDLVTCRNVMIYLKRDVQRDVIELFHYALRQDGYLVLGTSESIDAPDLFRTEDKKRCIFRRRSVRVPEPRLPVFPVVPSPVDHRPTARASHSEPSDFGRLHVRLLERFAPPSMVVRPDDKIAHLSEHCGRYLVHPGGELTASAYRLVREELRVELRSMLYKVRESHKPLQSYPILVRFNGDANPVVLNVRPAGEGDDEGYVLVIFDERTGTEQADGPAKERMKGPSVGATRETELEAELDQMRQRLQVIIEEYETSQEEMKASNEELQSANEELRSTMEELETSKEELQSMNEELQTVNQENRHKVEELAQLSGDLQNLMAATDIATLFLDRDLRILRFTPKVTELFNIRMTDRGRPIGDLTHRLGYDRLINDCERVLNQLVPVEREMQDESGRWYLTRVLVYRSGEDRIDGVVITFVEITRRKIAEEELRRSEEQFRALISASAQMVWTVDASGEMVIDSPTWRAFTGQSVDAIHGSGWLDAVHPDDRERTMSQWKQAIASSDPMHDEYRVIHAASGEYRWTSVRAVPLFDASGGVRGWVGMNIDIDASKRAEQAMTQLNATLEQRLEDGTRQIREMARHLTHVEQRERHRLAQLLHDDLQQQLYSIRIRTSQLTHVIESIEDASSHAVDAQGIYDALGTAIDLTRRMSVDLSPPVLEQETISAALSWLCSQMNVLHGLDVDVEAPATVTADDPDLRLLLYQSARELLFNVVKHSGTLRARLGLREEDGDVVMRVEDDGVGFDVNRAITADNDTFGLFDIRDRLSLVGGAIDIKSRPGNGTTVTIRLPSSRTSSQGQSNGGQ